MQESERVLVPPYDLRATCLWSTFQRDALAPCGANGGLIEISSPSFQWKGWVQADYIISVDFGLESIDVEIASDVEIDDIIQLDTAITV